MGPRGLISIALKAYRGAEQRAFNRMKLSLSSTEILAIEVLSRDLEIRQLTSPLRVYDMTSQLRYSNGWGNSTRYFSKSGGLIYLKFSPSVEISNLYITLKFGENMTTRF